MARPIENGLSYFPLDVDFDYDDKFQMILAKHHAEGCWIILIVLCKIYDSGYYYNWTEKEQLLTARRVNSDLTTVNSVITSAVEYGLFDKMIFERFSVLTSNGIQKRYLEATKKRKNIKIIKEYLINPDLTIVNSNLTTVNPDLTTQSKVKESKVKEIKVKEEENVYINGINVSENAVDVCHLSPNVNVKEKEDIYINTNVNVKEKEDIYINTCDPNLIKAEEHPLQVHIKKNCPNISKLKTQLTYAEAERLVVEFPNDGLQAVIEAMENYKLLAQKSISVNLTIRNWIRRNQNGTNRKNYTRGSVDINKWDRELKIARGEMPDLDAGAIK